MDVKAGMRMPISVEELMQAWFESQVENISEGSGKKLVMATVPTFKYEEMIIEVTPFITKPATVAIGKGVTIGLENYSSANVSVHITIPCYKEEVKKNYRRVNEMVTECLNEEVGAIQEWRRAKREEDEKANTE